MKIGIASDHRGYNLKAKLIKYLSKKGYEAIDYGTDSSESVDYPDFAFKLGEEYNKESFDYGIAICGNGIGISIACNKVKGVRCAKVDSKKEAIYARKHNDANIISIGTDKFFFEIKDIVDAFLDSNFTNEERHVRRINKIKDYENKK
ncbi:MAG TPA: RpiB/LacA/LacB family sugar-phosphate isomerase [Mollicutes bacterium]|nr:RpiB/LacA/LacB family sugar-phosphate isomerase [Mollicutes bacterium]